MSDTERLPVRPREDRDLAAAVRALRRVHERDGYPVNWPADPGRWLTPAGLSGAWVAGDGRSVAGHVALTRGEEGDVAPGLWGGGVTMVVNRLFVDPGARGSGLGELLLRAAADAARARGTRAVLDVVASGTAAVALYERLGWEFLGAGEQDWGGGQLVPVRCYAAPVTRADPAPGTV